MHRLLRDTHLVLGMAGVLFVLTYAVSAVQMAHRIRLTPQVEEEDLTLPPGLAARPLAESLMRQKGYGGEVGPPQVTPAGFRITINRPGTNFAIRYDTATGATHIRRETRSFLGMLNRLHHQNGLRHQDRRLNAWGWALAVVSIGLLLMGATGVYLWFRIHTERTIGAVLLAFNLLVPLALLVLLRR
jgi:hypothetical protein